jgi:hypothetical protein
MRASFYCGDVRKTVTLLGPAMRDQESTVGPKGGFELGLSGPWTQSMAFTVLVGDRGARRFGPGLRLRPPCHGLPPLGLDGSWERRPSEIVNTLRVLAALYR